MFISEKNEYKWLQQINIAKIAYVPKVLTGATINVCGILVLQ